MNSALLNNLETEKSALLSGLDWLKTHFSSGVETSHPTFQQLEQATHNLLTRISEVEKTLIYEKSLSYGLKESLNRFLVIQNLCELIGRSRDLRNITESLLSIAQRVISFNTAAVYLFDSVKGNYELHTEQELQPFHHTILQSHFDEGIISWVMSEKRAAVIPYFQEVTQDNRAPSRGFVIVPLLAANNRIGFMEIWRETIQDIRASTQLAMLELLARQAAIGIENSQLYERLNQANEMLKKSQAQAIEAEKMAAVGVLASGVAHEINNPLQVILARIQLLRKKSKDESQTPSLDLVERESLRISNIVKSILRYAKHQNQSHLELCKITALLNDTLMLTHSKLKLKNILTICDFDESIPALYLNIGEIEQVLLNLLENACHAMGEGGTLYVRAHHRKQILFIEIEDTGCGIPKEHISKIFEPFFTTKPPNEGTGLGLFLCYRIIERHEGRIHVESNENKGTKFTLQLPINLTGVPNEKNSNY